jgi:trimethylamine--corrinoid protein Co-methyltransferase
MRPTVRFLSDDLLEKIVSEAKTLLCELGVEIHNDGILSMLSDHGADVDIESQRVRLTADILETSLSTVPAEFYLYDVTGSETHHFSDNNVYFTPGSAAINVLDGSTNRMRPPLTRDYTDYLRVVSQMEHVASQSTALIPSEVPEKISDSYRLYLSLLFCEKPVVTGAFTIEGFDLMKEFLLAVRGSRSELEKKPLAIFSCCPTAPLKWSDVTSQNTVDCAVHSIPVEFISMPLSGFIAPVTLVGTLVQHTAETLSGIVISQLTRPGAPILYGGSPAIFDIRYQTTPMGAVETMMVDCAYNEIGKYLRMPTQAYIGLSDAKQLDFQAGLESSMGATLAALAGINNISGPGMIDFESCFSVEKLVVDNQLCGMISRLIEGVVPKEDFPSLPRFEELLKEGHLLISDHTRKYLKEEQYVPTGVVDRANRSRWERDGSQTLFQRAQAEVEQCLRDYRPSRVTSEVRSELVALMKKEASRYGMEQLPSIENEV